MKRRTLLIGAAAAATAAFTGGNLGQAETARAAMVYDPSYKTAHLYEYGNPVHDQSYSPHLNHVMQDFSHTSDGHVFVSQAETNSDGTENTVISRLDSAGNVIDYMRLMYAGHGIGVEVEYRAGVPWIYMTWKGASADSGWRSYDYVRFSWYPNIAGRPSGWGRGTCNQQFGLQVIQPYDPEMLVKIDWFRRFAVCKHYDNNGNDIFTRRRLDDMLAGNDIPLQRITVPLAGTTLQGFATVDDTLYKYSGVATSGGVMSSSDPIQIQSWDWNTQQPIANHTYPTLGQINGAWRDGAAEPEGMACYRGSDGYTQLLIGLTTGASGNHRWDTFRFNDIGI